MIKLNLNRNNIIVIIIIFFCYSIFMLYNTRGIFEKFESSANINRCADFTTEVGCIPNPLCKNSKIDTDCNSKPNCKWDRNKQKCIRKYNCRWAKLSETDTPKCYENAYLAKKLKNLKNFKDMKWDVKSSNLTGPSGKNLFSFEESEKNFKIYKFFCDKLKLLDKPNKNDIIFRKFTNDFLKKKKTHINKLSNQIKTLQTNMFEEDVSKFNTNKLRQHDQADKQYKAIVKGIENVKNRDKINLTLN